MEQIRQHSEELEIIIKERTQKLVAANKQLKNLNSLKDDFIANITHDFRSPLTISVMNSGIKIHLRLPPEDIDEFYLDGEKLEEVINNIISNAIKFINKEKGVIRVQPRDFTDHILIGIADNGIGIPGNKLRDICGRFKQTRQGRDSCLGGTGIGLAFLKELIRYMKGRIWAESEGEGKGAEFLIQLPKVMNVSENAEQDSAELNIVHHKKIKEIIRMDLKSKISENKTLVYKSELNKENEFDYHEFRCCLPERSCRVYRKKIEPAAPSSCVRD